MIISGFFTAIWDGWLYQQTSKANIAWKNRDSHPQGPEETNSNPTDVECIPLEENRVQGNETMRPRKSAPTTQELPQSSVEATGPTQSIEDPSQQHIIRIRVGILL